MGARRRHAGAASCRVANPCGGSGPSGGYDGAVRADSGVPVGFAVLKNANGRRVVADFFAHNVRHVCAGVEERITLSAETKARLSHHAFKLVEVSDEGAKLVVKGTLDPPEGDDVGNATGRFRYYQYDAPGGTCDTFVQHWGATTDP